MPIDPSIALGVKPVQLESPLNQLGQVFQLQGAQQANQLNRLKMDEYDRGVARQNQLLTLLGGLGDVPDEKRVSALRGGGYFDEADKLETGLLARQKTGAEAKAKEFEGLTKKLEVAGSTFGYVMKNPTLDNAMQALDYLGTNGIYTPEQVNQYKTQIQQNPASIGQLAETAFRSVLSAKDQLGKVDTVDAGNRQVTQVVDPITGKVKVAGEMTILQSEQSKAEITSREQEAAKGRGLQREIAEMNDKRQRDANEIARDKKAAAGAGNATEGERKAATLLQRMQNSEAQLEAALKKDQSAAKPGLISSGIRSMGMDTIANTVTPENRQKVEAAQLDILDAALTLGTGAAYTKEQLEGYRKSYFPQIGDKPDTIKDKQDRLSNVLSAARIAAGRAAGQVTGPSAAQDAGISPQDAQALAWANANPKDPRAAQIKQRLGQ